MRLTLQEFRQEYEKYLAQFSLEMAAQHPYSLQLDMALNLSNNLGYKIVHPLFIQRYRMPTRRVSTKPLELVGFDVETDAANGAPMLLGFSGDAYHSIHKPTLQQFIDYLIELRANNPAVQLVCWGQLDIQTIIRLFQPTEIERVMISRGINAKINNQKLISAPISRSITRGVAYISHYISGRSLRLGFIVNDWREEIWIFNLSQFYSARIAETARTFHIPWIDYPLDSHIIDWWCFTTTPTYRNIVLLSNRQDASTVRALASLLQRRFAEVFSSYPSILVSPGSLTDAATAASLTDDEYKACSQKWIIEHVWKDSSDPKTIAMLETLCAEAYSAGYIDQFGIGYFPIVHTADIASAYPHKIQMLPDLRDSFLSAKYSSVEIEATINRYLGLGMIFTAFIHGTVHIPPSLKFHPITIRTFNRENYRPTGDYQAAYTLQEREWCRERGATFENETGVFILLSRREPAPIAKVSHKLSLMRDKLLAERAKVDRTSEAFSVLDGQQYLVKVVNNSSYGKTVQTIPQIELIDDSPEIVGYITGDRFNQVWGAYITAKTRIQLAEACMQIHTAGGRPIMTMTDSIYWEGLPSDLPMSMINPIKTTGLFESVDTVYDMYLIKTGQYEYRSENHWTYKLRGIPIDRNTLHGDKPIYRPLISEWCAKLPSSTRSEDIVLKIPTRRLITIGRHDLDMLGAIQDGTTEISPFRLTSKNVERELPWKQLIDDHLWLATPHIEPARDATPLAFASQLYLDGFDVQRETKRVTNIRQLQRGYLRKKQYIVSRSLSTGIPIPLGHINHMSWPEIYEWYKSYECL